MLSENLNPKPSKSGSQGALKLNPSSGSMLGGEKMTVSGICFPTCCSLVQAEYVEWNVTFTCVLRSWDKAECFLPPVFRVGTVTLRFTAEPSLNCHQNLCGKHFDVSTKFSIYNFIKVPHKVDRENKSNWTNGNAVSIKWRRKEFQSSNINGAVLGYRSSPPSWEVVQYCSKVRSNGPHSQCWIVNLNISSEYSTAIVRVSERRRSPECEGKKRFDNCVVKAIYSDIFAVNSGKPEKSKEWCQRWVKAERQLPPLVDIKSCPTTYTLAKNDIAHFQIDPFCDAREKTLKPTCRYIDKVKACFRLVSPLENGGDQVCCYGEDGDLKSADDIYGWGTQQRYHFEGSNSVPTLGTFEKDILPALHCRYYNAEHYKDESLKLEYERLRPKSTTQGYEPPRPAQCAGDPHIVTLDGRKYTFNGIGEYVFTQDFKRMCVIQIRTIQARDIHNTLQRASIIGGVVMSGEGKPVIEVRRITQGPQYAEVLVDGNVVSSSAVQDRGFTLTVRKKQGRISSVLVVFDREGLSVEIEPTQYLLNVLLIVGSDLKGKLEGLLGNFNGNQEDDFTLRNGTRLGPNPTDKQIHELFGASWALTQNESRFTYPVGKGTFHFTDPSFKPYFLDDLIGQFNETEIRICGLKNTECLFDLKTTKNEEIANMTKNFVKMFEDIVQKTQPVTRCTFPPDFNGTTKNVTGLKVNNVTTYNCLNSSEIVTKVCKADGQWSSGDVSCEKVEPNPETPTKIEFLLIAGLGGGAGAVLLIIVVTITVYFCKRKRKKPPPKEVSEESIDMEDLTIYDMFKNEAFLQKLQEITEDGSFKLPRPFLEDRSLRSLYEEYF